MADQRRTWQRLMGPVWRRIRLLVSRGVLKLVDDSLKLQGVQVSLLGGEPAWAERFQEYGYTSHPHPGAEAIVAAVGGARAHLVALSVDDRRYRPKGLAAGEVCLYTDEGDEIRFKRGKIIAVKAGSKLEVTAPEAVFNCSTSVTLNTPKVIATGDIEAAGQVRDATGTMQGMRDTYNGHNHGGDSGGTTSTPNQEMG
ncbi:phage baseplate assembly protein V [Marinobacter subterrani]|uniref:Phage baseplate assembly protein V n=1 Tax=Marinobacter subterrani TaxID=1658765 RepID=A0A0J7J7R1_9GAMM|nr:phage baseplate assembly protein V [Marinobacter subterrani]KMQ73994.1 phage baseplate assembly protein V [Marinobacter subterrani]